MNFPFASIQKVRIGEEMATNPAKNKEKKPGIFQWLIVVLVSLIFTILVTVVILYVMGVDISKYTKDKQGSFYRREHNDRRRRVIRK